MTTAVKPAVRGTPARPVRRRRRPLRTWVFAIAAYVVAAIFLLPYLEMLIMALRPNNELGLATILPRHWTFANFTTLWSTGLGGSIGTSLEIAAGATVLVLLVALPAAYCTARRRFRGRGLFLILVLATQMFQPAAMLVGVQREFINFACPRPCRSSSSTPASTSPSRCGSSTPSSPRSRPSSRRRPWSTASAGSAR
jgi:multiple sugar transport system permease protein